MSAEMEKTEPDETESVQPAVVLAASVNEWARQKREEQARANVDDLIARLREGVLADEAEWLQSEALKVYLAANARGDTWLPVPVEPAPVRGAKPEAK